MWQLVKPLFYLTEPPASMSAQPAHCTHPLRPTYRLSSSVALIGLRAFAPPALQPAAYSRGLSLLRALPFASRSPKSARAATATQKTNMSQPPLGHSEAGAAPDSTDFANYFCTYAYLYHQVGGCSFLLFSFSVCLCICIIYLGSQHKLPMPFGTSGNYSAVFPLISCLLCLGNAHRECGQFLGLTEAGKHWSAVLCPAYAQKEMLEDHKRTGAYYQAVMSNRKQFHNKVGPKVACKLLCAVPIMQFAVVSQIARSPDTIACIACLCCVHSLHNSFSLTTATWSLGCGNSISQGLRARQCHPHRPALSPFES